MLSESRRKERLEESALASNTTDKVSNVYDGDQAEHVDIKEI